jgi:hypothetical protein
VILRFFGYTWYMTAGPLVAGVILSVLGGIVRVKAWHRSATNACGGIEVRYRDVIHAHLGGAGFSGIVPAHGGDAVKLALLKRRTEGAPFGLLLGSLAPPAARGRWGPACSARRRTDRSHCRWSAPRWSWPPR